MRRISNTIFIDVSILLQVKSHLTGISRVIFRTAEHLLNEHPEIEVFGLSVHDEQRFLISSAQLSALLKKIEPTFKILREVNDQVPEVSDGDLILALGEQWLYPNAPKIYRQLKSENGARIVMLVHDLVPFFSPEFYWPGFPESFMSCMRDMSAMSSGILTYSNSTTKDVERYLRPVLGDQTQIREIRLGVDRAKTLSPPQSQAEPFVLVVGTIQPRKNHLLLSYVWRRLIAEGTKVPKLVVVGERGWNVDDLFYLIENNEFLREKIEIRKNVTDQELEGLYQSCLFTVFPSFYEGWGLPVAESLKFGKFCLASGSSSIPEVGGDLLDYFSPYDSGELYRLVKVYLTDSDLLKRRENEIRSKYQCPEWSTMVKQIVDFTTTLPS